MTASIASVGFSENADSYHAGFEAASKAALADETKSGWQLAILISTSRHDPAKLRDGVQAVIGKSCKLIGGYGVGIITNSNLAYDGYQVGVLLLALSEKSSLDIFLGENLAGHENAVGRQLGKLIQDKEYSGEPSVILLYDSVNRLQGSFRMNMATHLLDGMRDELAAWPRMVGAGMVGDMQCRETYQWCDGQVLQQSAMALVLSGAMRIDSAVMHGCRPSSSYHRITKTDQNVVLEIDGIPALDKISELLGADSGKTWRDYSFFVTLGVNRGDKFAAFNEELYANRLCMGVDQERKGLVMFEPDLVPGCEVQLMRRDMDFGYIREKVKKLLASLNGRKPIFAFYIDCAGRAASYSGFNAEEASEVQKALGNIPLLGFYSGVEIGNVAGEPVPLDWTGVLAIASESESRPHHCGRIAPSVHDEPIDVAELSGILDSQYAHLTTAELRLHISEAEAKASELQKATGYYATLTDELAGQNVKNDSSISMLNNELRIKNQGVAILANLQARIREGQTLERLCRTTIQEINATLKMDKTLILLFEDGEFRPAFWSGFNDSESKGLPDIRMPYDAAWMESGYVLANRKSGKIEAAQKIKDILPLPFFIGVPIRESDKTIGLLISGRMKEAKPFYPPLEKGDIDTFVAISGFLSATNQLNRQREHLEQLNRTLEQKVQERTVDLQGALDELEVAHETVHSSIQYASRIQRATLPTESYFSSIVPNHFVLWEPRDVVGGDIYWCKPWGDGCLIILGDCTGHGVPGAFMTMLSTGALERAILEIAPGHVEGLVQHMHRVLQSTLNQDSEVGHSDDGIEMGVCFLNADKSRMSFVGARFDLYVLENGALNIVKGSKSGMGYRGIPYNQEFERREIVTNNDMTFYLVSDGVVDQIGADTGWGLGRKRLTEWLVEAGVLPLHEQKIHLYNKFLAYQGSAKRRDDVSVVGFRV